MIKIMIVDDMPMFLEYLQGCIDWESYGFQICAQAKDGKEALQIFEDSYPDIVLTDITMPYINGLELAEQIMKKYSETSVVLITGNNEFEYARKAVKLGVCDYIVKPFEKEELIICLLKLQDNINRALEMKTKIQEEEAEKKEALLRKIVFSDLIHQEDFYKQQLSESGITLDTPYFLVYTIKVDNYDNFVKYEDIHQWDEILLKILRDMVKVEGNFEVFRDFENSIVAILNFKDEIQMKKYKEYEFQDLIKVMNDQLAFQVIVGISDYCYGLTGLKDGYYQTLQALNSYTKQGSKRILDYKKMNLIGENVFYSWDFIEAINHNLKEGDYEKIEKVINDEFKRIEAYQNEEISRMVYMSLLSCILSYLLRMGRNVEDVFGMGLSPFQALKEVGTLEEKKELVINCYKQAMEYEKRSMSSKAYVIAEQAKLYIEANYIHSDLNIAAISKELYVNQTYLRKMFKSEMNMTLSEYITKYRMEKAKEIITNRQEKLMYVAELVGYSDISYFSKCFKKYYGMSPKSMMK